MIAIINSIFLIVFFGCIYAILHSYVIYPILLKILASNKTGNSVIFSGTESDLPTVAIIMAAYNEEKVIEEKIKSVLNTSYPKEKITIYIGSDASTDATNSLVANFNLPNVVLVNFGGRSGKSFIINELAAKANQELFILTDANVIFKATTIFELVKHFKNQQIGQVAANIIKQSSTNDGIAEQEKKYISFENKIKHAESLIWKTVIGAEGGCYAIRKNCYAPVPKNFFMDDFYITLNVIEQKRNVVFEENAICFEDVPIEATEEFKRKIRISIGNFQNLNRYKKLLLPPFSGQAFAFLSHKVLRWFTPFFMILVFIINAYFALFSPFFLVLLCLQLIGYLIAIGSIVLKPNNFFLKLIGHFVLMNLALFIGYIKYKKGVKSSIWEPTKRNV